MKKLMSEKETKASIIELARKNGCEDKVKKIIYNFEEAVKTAATEEEAKQLAVLGLVELHKTIGCVGALIIDGVEVLPANTTYQEAIDLHKGLVKLD